MKGYRRFVLHLGVMLLAACLLAGPARAQGKPELPAFKATPRNTLTFDHLALAVESASPLALEVGDGDLFQVVVARTDPRFFKYTISVVAEESRGSSAGPTGEPVTLQVRPTGRANLVMRHARQFLKYRVKIELMKPVAGTAPVTPGATGAPTLGVDPDAPPSGTSGAVFPLYPAEFDVFVVTRPTWNYGVSGGVALSSLTDRKFYVKKDAAGKETFEEDVDGRDGVNHDIVALANVYYDYQRLRGLMFGAAFGIGQNSSGSPRYYVGPSMILGRYFVFTGGMAFGSTATLPTGQKLGEAPINGANTLNNLGRRFHAGWFFSVAFTFIDKKNDFIGAFTSTTTASAEGTPAAKSPEAKAPAAGDSPPGAADLEGEYLADSALKIIVAAIVKDGKKTEALTLKFVEDARAIEVSKGKTAGVYTDSAGTYEATFSGTRGAVVLQVKKDGQVMLTLNKRKAS